MFYFHSTILFRLEIESKIMTEIKAAIEAGGTKWICAIGNKDGHIIEERMIHTSSPSQTLEKVINQLKQLELKYGDFRGIGIGSFGPISIDTKSSEYGRFLNTPKEGWSDFNMIQPLQKAFKDKEFYLDTDVNTAVYAEAILGAGKGKRHICYITVGTGIGGGVFLNGRILHGRMHPEIGHITVQESPLEPTINFSACPYHNHCVEGKASGTAMKQRWKVEPKDFPDIAWTLEAHYLAQLAVTLTATYSPDLIVFGGGVSNHEGLIPLIQDEFIRLANQYWVLPPVKEYIIRSELNNRAGLIGALLLAP